MLPQGGGGGEMLIYEMKKSVAKINSEMRIYHKNTLYLCTLLRFKSNSFSICNLLKNKV